MSKLTYPRDGRVPEDEPLTDVIVIIEIFAKKTRKTPSRVVEVCRERLKRYDDA
jgi:hypothetical protein